MGSDPLKVYRTLLVRAGMTPEEVMNAEGATKAQKELALIFDSDGIAGYSQQEADIFNATLITMRSDNDISLFTRYKDGTIVETKVTGDLTAFKYAPKKEVDPYEICDCSCCQLGITLDNIELSPANLFRLDAEQAYKRLQKALEKQDMEEEEKEKKLNFVQHIGNKIKNIFSNHSQIQHVHFEKHENGNIKSIKYQYDGKDVLINYLENGKVDIASIMDNGKQVITEVNEAYYENGHLASKRKEENDGSKVTLTKYYPNGQLKSLIIKEKKGEKYEITVNKTY